MSGELERVGEACRDAVAEASEDGSEAGGELAGSWLKCNPVQKSEASGVQRRACNGAKAATARAASMRPTITCRGWSMIEPGGVSTKLTPNMPILYLGVLGQENVG